MSNKRGTTIRLSQVTRERLQNASRILDESKCEIVEQALHDWFTTHNLIEGYQVNLTENSVVLLETGDQPRILEITERNGIPPQEVAQQYKEKLQAPVRLVIQEESTWPKKQS